MMILLDSGRQRSNVKVTANRRGAKIRTWTLGIKVIF